MPAKKLKDGGDGTSETVNGAIDYEVGFKRPPKHTKFKKGRSGHPKGRPRGAKNSATLLIEELEKTAVVVAGGKRKTMTKREIMIAQLVNKAVSRDPRFMRLVLDRSAPIEARAEHQAKLEAEEQASRETWEQGMNTPDRVRAVVEILESCGALDLAAKQEAGSGADNGGSHHGNGAARRSLK